MKWLIDKEGWRLLAGIAVVCLLVFLTLLDCGGLELPADCYGSGYNKICD